MTNRAHSRGRKEALKRTRQEAKQMARKYALVFIRLDDGSWVRTSGTHNITELRKLPYRYYVATRRGNHYLGAAGSLKLRHMPKEQIDMMLRMKGLKV